MISQKSVSSSVLFFTKTTLQWWNAETQQVQNFEYPPESLADLDIVNEEGFQNGFVDWLNQTNQKPQSVAIILADEVYFTKDFAATTDTEAIEVLQQQFCELVPFDNVLCKSFPVESALRVFAINKGLYEIVVKTLEGQKFYVENLFPQFLFPVDFSQGLTLENAKQIQSSLESVKQIGLIDPKKKKEEEQKKFIKRQFTITKEVTIATGVFVFLIAVLGVLIWNTHQQNKALEQKNAQKAAEIVTEVPPESIMPLPSPTVIPIASSSAIQQNTQVLQNLPVQVLNGSNESGKAEEVKLSLEEAGAERITTGNASEKNPGRTLIIVKPSVSSELREQLITIIQNTTSEYSMQENAELTQFDVVINIGQTGLLK